MQIPYLQSVNATQAKTLEFKGLNRNLTVSDGEAKVFRNLSTEDYPCLRPIRQGTSTKLYSNGLNGIYYKNKLIECIGTKLYFDSVEVTEITLSDTPKRFAEFQAYLFILPDKKYINTALYGTDDIPDGAKVVGDMDTEIEASKCSFLSVVGDTSDGIRGQIKDFTQVWCGGANVDGFKTGDVVEISGMDYSNYDGSYEVLGVDGECLLLQPNLFGLSGADEEFTESGTITIKREFPVLDFYVECNGRLWGCNSEYGTSGSEIKASKAGDPWNWSYYNDNTPDAKSFSASIASDGEFTACTAYQGSVYFFKEDKIYQIYGSRPANFQAVEVAAQGVEKGSDKSLCIINEVLYYKSKTGIMQFTGGLPSKVSYKLGTAEYTNAMAGTDGRNYYVTMKEDDVLKLFVYDTVCGIWHEESLSCDGSIGFVYTDKLQHLLKSNNQVRAVAVASGTRNDVGWEMVTGDIDYTSPNKKYVKKIAVRLELAKGSELYIHIIYDNKPPVECAYYYGDDNKTSYHFNLSPKRCDHFNLVLDGTGDCVIYQITKYVSSGSDV